VPVELAHLFGRESNLLAEHFEHTRRGATVLEEGGILVQAPEGKLYGISLGQRILHLVEVRVDSMLPPPPVVDESLDEGRHRRHGHPRARDGARGRRATAAAGSGGGASAAASAARVVTGRVASGGGRRPQVRLMLRRIVRRVRRCVRRRVGGRVRRAHLAGVRRRVVGVHRRAGRAVRRRRVAWRRVERSGVALRMVAAAVVAAIVACRGRASWLVRSRMRRGMRRRVRLVVLLRVVRRRVVVRWRVVVVRRRMWVMRAMWRRAGSVLVVLRMRRWRA